MLETLTAALHCTDSGYECTNEWMWSHEE